MNRLLLSTLLLFSSASALTASPYLIKGRITTTSGEALPFAYVRVEGKRYATQADKDGYYTLKLPDGHYEIKANLLGYNPLSKQVRATADTQLDFSLTEDMIHLQSTTVTGTRTPKLLGKTPVVTQIITADDIAKIDATNIKDVLLTELPGVEFTLSMNQQVSLNMQGLGGMAILFLIDGERMAGETLDNVDFQRISTDNIERIEIVKGAASALYGSNSVGAVINIITKKATEPWSLNLNTLFGSQHNEQRHGGSFGLHSGKWNSLTNVQTDGTHSYTLSGKEAGNQMSVYGTRQWNFKEKLTYQFNDHTSLTGRAGYYFHERNSSETANDRARDFSGGLRFLTQFGGRNQLDVSYSFDRYDKSDYYKEIRKDFIDYKNTQNSLRALYTHHLLDHLALTVGGDAMMDYLMTYQFTDGGHRRQYTADAFAQADWTLTDHWNIVAGARADYFSKTGWKMTPKLAAMYHTGNLKFRGSYSGGFRAPTLKELYMDFNMANIFNIHGNPNLRAENSHSFCFSGEYAKSRYSLTATGYYNIVNNEITTIWDKSLENGRGAMVYQNIEGRNLLGVDVSLMARYPCGLGGKLSYSFFHEYTRNGRPNTSDTRPHSLTARIDYHKTLKNYEIDAALTGRYLASAHYHELESGNYDTYTAASSPAYSLWKFTLTQRFFQAWRLILSVDNLFNYRPKTYAYNSPLNGGTSFSAGISVDVDQIFRKK